MEFLKWVQRYFSIYYLQQTNDSRSADRIQCGDCILSKYLMLLIEYYLSAIRFNQSLKRSGYFPGLGNPGLQLDDNM
jgi:hypothetical protein